MAQKIIKHVKDMVAEANREVEIMPVVEASKFFENEEYVFVDIRDPREIQREGKIPNSFSCPRGMLEFWIDPNSPYHKEIFNQDKKYVFYCAAAGRSALARLQEIADRRRIARDPADHRQHARRKPPEPASMLAGTTAPGRAVALARNGIAIGAAKPARC